MYEVEVKVRTDHDEVRDRLQALDATAVGTVTQVDTYFDAPHREFTETDEALRIRREERADGSEARLTYKGPLVETASKTREERETAVGDEAEAHAIFESLGFTPAATVHKERERFTHDGFTVTLDSVDDVGEFVEVEAEVDAESAVESRREAAFEVLRELGLDPDDQTRTSYLGFLLESDRDVQE